MSRLLHAAGGLVERIKINAISRQTREGREVWMKRRRLAAAPVLAGANAFFRLAGAPVRAITDRAAWQRWEVDCFTGLHGAEGFHAFADGVWRVGADVLPGVNLSDFLDGDALTPALAAAAGRELRRAHAWTCPALGAPWSHGDPHLGNFIVDPAAEHARIIDFEMRHAPEIPAAERHADDLLTFLQDMAGRISAARWLPCARSFLEACDSPAALAILAPRLTLPRPGAARIWWRVRTGFLPLPELRRRLHELRSAFTTVRHPERSEGSRGARSA